MVKVILRNDFFADGHHFRKHPDGGAVDIPENIVERGLPKSAKIVDEDFEQPEEPEDQREADEVTAAREEARVIKEVEETLDTRRRRRSEAPADGDILSQSIKVISDKLPEMNEAELRKLLEREREGKSRPSLIVQIEAAIEDLGNKE